MTDSAIANISHTNVFEERSSDAQCAHQQECIRAWRSREFHCGSGQLSVRSRSLTSPSYAQSPDTDSAGKLTQSCGEGRDKSGLYHAKSRQRGHGHWIQCSTTGDDSTRLSWVGAKHDKSAWSAYRVHVYTHSEGGNGRQLHVLCAFAGYFQGSDYLPRATPRS